MRTVFSKNLKISQNSVFDLKNATGSNKLKSYHASSNRRVGG